MRLRTWAAVAIFATSSFGCGEEEPTIKPEPKVLPTFDEPVYSTGNWAQEQRGIAIDSDDLAVIQTGDQPVGISTTAITDKFGVLVLNRPYVDWRASICAPSDEAETYQPLATAGRFLDEIEMAKSLNFDRIAVNVDLLTPGRRSLNYSCFDEGASKPRFEELEHRAKIIEAFEDLAELPGIAYITVGLEMNRYYHLTIDGERPWDDYSNWVTLYREVYAAIKAKNSSVKVGPGISWAVFQRLTVPEVASEFEIDPNGLEAAWIASQRTVEPLLFKIRGRQPTPTADFLGVSMIPFDSEPPFQGDPTTVSEADIERYYRYLPLVAGGLPVVLPQIDWPSVGGNANLKGPFLSKLKHGVSHVDVEWAAWRRLADLPDTQQASPCKRFTGSSEPTLRYPEEYCSSGMIAESGRPRDVLDIFTESP